MIARIEGYGKQSTIGASVLKFLNVGWPAFSLAMFLVAGNLKSSPTFKAIPVDLTAAFAGLTLVLCVGVYLMRRPSINPTIGWVFLLYLCFIVTGFYTEWTPYATEKFVRFVTLTLLSFIAPFILFTTWPEIGRLINAIVIIALIITFDGLGMLMENFGHWNAESRLTASGDNTIALARYAGMVGINLVLRAADRSNMKFVISLMGVIAVIGVMLGTGSRGPILSALISLFLSFFFFYRQNMRVVARVFLMIGGIIVFLAAGSNLLPGRSMQRIEMFFSSEGLTTRHENESVLERENAIAVSVEKIRTSPMGIGVGGFERITRTHGRAMVYPHNLLLELLMENGWITGMIFLTIILIALRRFIVIALKENCLEARVAFCLILFYFINSLVSGDLNDNRYLYLFISIGLAVPYGKKVTVRS
jgi:O-antigen ligase